ncbi:DUF4238 domain-containing protein [Candidatus Electrothrix aarhusensis]
MDETPRSISDSIEEVEVDAWFPSNSAAQKLWRCLESLRDLDELLSDSAQQKNATKRKRRLKIALTPLHSLVKCVDDLCNDIQCNKETQRLLEDSAVKEISGIQKRFSELLPHDHKAVISTARNKLSAHIDKKIHPSEAQKIGSVITPNEFGRWLHICLHLVLDLTKLNIYHWSCKPPGDEYVCFMTSEPFLVTFKLKDEEVDELAAINIASSPRNAVPEVIESLVRNSQWMFKKGQQRIRSLQGDHRDNWNTFNEYSYIHEPNL